MCQGASGRTCSSIISILRSRIQASLAPGSEQDLVLRRAHAMAKRHPAVLRATRHDAHGGRILNRSRNLSSIIPRTRSLAFGMQARPIGNGFFSESQSKSFSMNGSTGSSKTASNSVRTKILSAPFSSKNLSKSLQKFEFAEDVRSLR